MGMIMWGMTLRSGWGVKTDQDEGFYWLKKAADTAVTDMEKVGDRENEETIKVSA
jgi:TPR repeat protein